MLPVLLALPMSALRAISSKHKMTVEQGPSSASVELIELSTSARRTLSVEPHFARRLWYLNDTYVIWGDQGAEGRSFVPLNTEILWVERL